MSDRVNVLAQVLLDALEDATAYGSDLEGFTVYDEYPETGSLHFPCVVVLREPSGPIDWLFAGDMMCGLTLNVELAFKEKTGFVAREHDYLSTEKLVMWYEERLNELVRHLRWDAEVPVESVITTCERHFPQEKNQELYGLTYHIVLTYANTGD